MRQILSAAFLTVLSGCATTANYEKILNSWVGANEIDLVRNWGTPQRVYETGGTKFLTFASSRNIYMPGTAPTYTTTYIGNTAYTTRTGGSPSQNIGMICITTFEIKNDRVVTWRWEGNDCKARE
jgi:hypothetical protein